MRWLVYVNFLVPLLLEEFFNPIGQLLGFIEQSFNYLLKLILNIANFLFLLLVRVANFLLATVRVLAHGLRHVISDIVHGRFRHLFEDYLRLKAKLRAFFEPVLRVLRRIRQIFDQFFKQFIAPVLNLLQTFRKILVIFRIFHLKFAEALDRKIRRIEARIITNTLVLRQRINQISTILTLILNPELLIRGRTLIGSLISAIDDVLRSIFGTTLRAIIGPASPATLDRRTGFAPKDDVLSMRSALLRPRTAAGTAAIQGEALFNAVRKDRGE